MSEFNMKSLKVGDKVLRVVNGFYFNRYDEVIVTHVWPSGRVGVGSQTFNPDGYERGTNRYTRNSSRLIAFDQSLLDEQTREADIKRNRQFLKDPSLWSNLSDEFILEITAKVKAELNSPKE